MTNYFEFRSLRIKDKIFQVGNVWKRIISGTSRTLTTFALSGGRETVSTTLIFRWDKNGGGNFPEYFFRIYTDFALIAILQIAIKFLCDTPSPTPDWSLFILFLNWYGGTLPAEGSDLIYVRHWGALAAGDPLEHYARPCKDSRSYTV